MKKILLILTLVLSPVFVFGQNTDVNSVNYTPYTATTLPSASTNSGRTFLITDGVSETDCSSGSGTTQVYCRSNGSSYNSVSSGPVSLGQLNNSSGASGQIPCVGSGGNSLSWLAPSIGYFFSINSSNLCFWDTNLQDTGTAIQVFASGGLITPKLTVTGPFYTETPAASGNPAAPGTGFVAALVIGSDGNWYIYPQGAAGYGQIWANPGTGSTPNAVVLNQGLVGTGAGTLGNFTWPICTSTQAITSTAGTFSPSCISVGSVTNALTINNSGSGASSGATFDGSSAVTISYNTLGAANTTLSNLGTTSINSALLATAGSTNLGSTTHPWTNLYLVGSGTFGSSSLDFTGTPTANRTVTFPDNTGTVAELNLAQTFSAVQTISASNGLVLSAMTGTNCLEEVSGVVTSTGSACGTSGGANTALSNLAAVAINLGLLPGTTNTIALGSSSDLWSNVFATLVTTNTAPTVTTPGTGWYLFGTEGTEPASIAASTTGFVMDSTSHCPIEWNNAVNVGCAAALSKAQTWAAVQTIPNTDLAISGLTSAFALATNSSGNPVLATSTANTLSGFNASGNAADVTIGTGLTLSGGTLTSTATGTPCTTTASSLQYDNAGAFGCTTPFTFASSTITAAAAGIIDLHAATGTAAFLVPTAAGETATAAGAIDFDTTNKNYHGFVNGADSIFANYAAAPTSGFIPKASVSSGNTLLASSLLDDGHTTVNWLTYSGVGGFAITGSGAVITEGTAPTVTTPGTGFYALGTEGTEPGSIASGTTGFVMDSTSHCPIEWNNAVNYGCMKPGYTLQVVTSDFTTASTTFVTITGLSKALPLVAANWSFECDLVMSQATAGAADQFGLQTATNGATNTAATGIIYTAAGVSAAASTTGNASSTTTFSIVTATPGATGTKLPVHLAGTIEGTSASGTTLNIQVLSGSGSDTITIYRGSQCRVY